HSRSCVNCSRFTILHPDDLALFLVSGLVSILWFEDFNGVSILFNSMPCAARRCRRRSPEAPCLNTPYRFTHTHLLSVAGTGYGGMKGGNPRLGQQGRQRAADRRRRQAHPDVRGASAIACGRPAPGLEFGNVSRSVLGE